MKRIVSIILSTVMILSMFSIVSFAEAGTEPEKSVGVYLSIADKDGKLALTQEKITAKDADKDGQITINDVFITAHDAKFEGGSKAGYTTADGAYGLMITKFWGVEGGNCGYYHNNAMAMSLTTPVKDGDYINAYLLRDTTTFSDKYCFFNENKIKADLNGEVSLTLTAVGFDAEYNPVNNPVKDAIITINGKDTAFKTDAEGKVTIKLETAGIVTISARSETETLVPPVCLATVSTDEKADVFVTISDKDAKLALTQEKITVTDADKDGLLTINDALYNAHEAKFEGGAKAGYVTADGSYGLWISKFWGVEGGSCGYYLNNAMAMSLTTPVKDGDYINAYLFTDTTNFSDKYCFFDKNTLTVSENGDITLTLNSVGFDAEYNPVNTPVKDAVITVNGADTTYKTDAEGKVTFKVEGKGNFVISAKSETDKLVPPACVVTVNAAEKTPAPATDKNTTVIIVISVVVIVAICGAVIGTYIAKKNKKA